MAPSWSGREGLVMTPLLELEKKPGHGPLLELEKSHGHGPLLDLERRSGLDHLVEWEMRRRLDPPPGELEKRRGLSPL